MTAEKDTAKDEAAAQSSSIIAYVSALECDYERLEELQGELAELHEEVNTCDDGEDTSLAANALHSWLQENEKELAELESAAGDCKDSDEARERIQEDALDVQVRSGWASAGEELKAEEFCILLCTGVPACRIVGELDEYMQPCRAWMEYQDWGTPWTRYYEIEQSTLLAYAQCFYFGE